MKLKLKKMEYISKTFRLPTDLAEELAATAQKNGISMTKLVITLCQYGLDNLDDADKPNNFNSD